MHITEKSSFFFFQLCIVSTWCDISEMRLDDVLLVQLSVSLSLSLSLCEGPIRLLSHSGRHWCRDTFVWVGPLGKLTNGQFSVFLMVHLLAPEKVS